MTRVRADEFDAAIVRMMMDADPSFGLALDHFVGQLLAHRLFSRRTSDTPSSASLPYPWGWM